MKKWKKKIIVIKKADYMQDLDFIKGWIRFEHERHMEPFTDWYIADISGREFKKTWHITIILKKKDEVYWDL